VNEVWGLFVDDGALATAAVAALLAIAVFVDHEATGKGIAAWLLVLGIVAAMAISLSGSLRQSAKRVPAASAAGAVDAILKDHQNHETVMVDEKQAQRVD
jgi:uncharacterized membrane-anchored protein